MSVGYAVDIGGTKLAAARIEDGKIVDRVQVATRTQADAGALLAQGAALLHQLGYRAGASVGIAVTGRVTADGRWNAVNAETLPAVNNAPIARLATELFGTVRLGNDALAAALAEAEVSGAAAGENFAYITVSTGVGGGVVLTGAPLTSPDGVAGHIGFMSSPHASAMCGSGRFGTVESVAAGRAIAAAAKAQGHDMDARAVFGAAQSGAAWAVELVDRSARTIATLGGDLCAGLGVRRIALGGSIGLAPGYLARVQQFLNDEPDLFRPQIAPAVLGSDSALLGAMMLPEYGAAQ